MFDKFAVIRLRTHSAVAHGRHWNKISSKTFSEINRMNRQNSSPTDISVDPPGYYEYLTARPSNSVKVRNFESIRDKTFILSVVDRSRIILGTANHFVGRQFQRELGRGVHQQSAEGWQQEGNHKRFMQKIVESASGNRCGV